MITPKNEKYPQVAFCSAVTPATPEHYEGLKKAGVTAVSICVHSSGFDFIYKYAHMHTNLARKAGFTTHAYATTDLYDVTTDIIEIMRRVIQLGYTAGSKLTIWINADKRVKDKEERIIKLLNGLSRYHPRELIDIAFYGRDLDAGLYDLSKLPKLINLTIIRVGAISSGLTEAGTWAYGDIDYTTIAYDYYGYYTEGGFQLSLVDSDYIVQQGDTWYSISRRHGIPLEDLLMLNRALADDKLYAGQVVRIA